MQTLISPSYVPALRMKVGELVGLSSLAEDIAQKVLPRLIVPPPKERDAQLQKELFRLPHQPRVHGVLSSHWVGKPALLQSTYLLKEVDLPGKWLPSLFGNAREYGVQLIPTFTLAEVAEHSGVIRNIIRVTDDFHLALIVMSAETVAEDINARIEGFLLALGTEPSRCALLLDFSDAEISEPEIVAPIMRAAFQKLREIGEWRFLAFQGTSYPEQNPAGHGAVIRVERNEWLAWVAAVEYQRNTPDRLLFGDFAADSARLSFTKARARAIRHLRYTTDECWFVVRAAEKGRDASLMWDVCNRIAKSKWYDGRNYSVADDQIFRIAQFMRGPGTATDWRAINTGHHITRVVRDLGVVKERFYSLLRASELEAPAENIPNLIDR